MKQLLIFPFFIVLSTLGTSCTNPEVKQPNILWIIAEDLNPVLGCYQDEINSGFTPAVDGLASEGVLFKRAYATAPVCSASRSAFITGVMQTTLGTHNHRSSRTTDNVVVPEELRIYLPEGVKTIPELMKEQGYFTFSNNKDDYNFHYNRHDLYDVGTRKNYKVGMNGWQGNMPSSLLSWTKNVWNSRPDKKMPWFGQIELWGGKKDSKHVREGQKLEDYDVELPPYFPDIPSQRQAWTEHYNAARGSDTQVEAILKQLEADGELENTIVFFFSDHGSPSSLRHKQFCYEGGMQVPLIIAGAHKAIKPGSSVNNLVSLLDVSATTLALAGGSIPDHFDGQDLFSDDYQTVDYVIGARDRCDYTIDHIRTVRTDQYRYIQNYFPERTMMQPSYRDNKPIVLDFKKAREDDLLTPYQEEHWFGKRPEEELYDVAKDPHQMHNLALESQFKSELKKHRKILNDWIERTDDKGMYPEDKNQLRATYELWKDRERFKNADVNPEYDEFK
ncbi:sulfatase [Flavicella sp.]|uniref:sulfatase family protein n=1 Tax=Flavicella sp. TaxID=2957742 RepID=UPI00260C3B7C|nr:sulfatase [Flavicella sp.]MDG1804284.1 sulfatase [Flavicella sp.]